MFLFYNFCARKVYVVKDCLLIGVWSHVSISASQSSLKPSFDRNYNITASITLISETTTMKTDALHGITSLVKGLSTKTESYIDYTGSEYLQINSAVHTTCPPANNLSALSIAREMEETSKLQIYEHSQHLQPTSFTVATGDESLLMTSTTQSNILLSEHVLSIEANYTNSSKESTSDQKSYIFALVFGTVGGLLVFGIVFMIFKNVYTKSKNRVKKIKRTRGGSV